jgi:hypothetical protein
MTEHLWLLVCGDSLVSHWGQRGTANDKYFNPSQLVELDCPAAKTIPSLRVPHPSYAVENGIVMTELVCNEQEMLAEYLAKW